MNTSNSLQQELKTKLQKIESFDNHSEEIKSILIGNLLGDGHIEKRGNSTRIKLYFGGLNLQYAKFLHKKLSDLGYCNTNEIVIKHRKTISKKTKKNHSNVSFSTYAFRSFNELHAIWYKTPTEEELLSYSNKNGVCRYIKVVPSNLSKYLTPLALAIWLMDDGDFNKQNKIIRISTHSFNKKEIDLLICVLHDKFNLNFTVQKDGIGMQSKKQQFRFYLSKIQISLLISIVKIHFIPEMYYKLGLDLK